MFHVMLYSQWKWTRLIVALGSIAAFALPIVSVQGAARADASPLQAGELLQAVQSWGTLYPVLAAALGLLVAIATWAPDHRGRHVHALSLPLPRWRYVLLRFGQRVQDRKSTRLNSSHSQISYAVFCLKPNEEIERSFLAY